MLKSEIQKIFQTINEIDIKNKSILVLKDDIDKFTTYNEYENLPFRKKIEFIFLDQIELFEEIDFVKVFENHLLKSDGKINSSKLRNKIIVYFLDRIDSTFPELKNYNLEHKWYYLKHSLSEIPKCDGCSKQLKMFVWGRRFCSQNCAVTSTEARERARINSSGRVLNDIQKQSISDRSKEMWMSEEFRNDIIPKLKIANQGNGKHFLKEDGKPWNYGIPTPKETIEKAMKTREARGISFKGKNNPQFGKSPSPEAGRGINGRFKGIWFRSSLELFYLLYFSNNHISFRTAETKEFEVGYSIDGNIHTYKPDFFIESTEKLYEIKPKKRITEKVNILKMEALKKKFGADKCMFMTEEDIKEFIDKVEIKFILDIIKNKQLVLSEKQEKRLLSNFKRIQYDTTRSV